MRLPFSLIKISDSSMEPGIKNGEYLLINGLSRKIKQGDIIALRHPYREIALVKRIKNIDDEKRYFVGGDNDSETAEDSREFGPVTEKHIIGKVMFKSK